MNPVALQQATPIKIAILGVLPSRGGIVFGGKRQEHAEIKERVAACATRTKRWPRSTTGSRACANAARNCRARCPAANARYWRWAAR